VFLDVTVSSGTPVPVLVSVCAVVVHRLKSGQLCGVPGCDMSSGTPVPVLMSVCAVVVHRLKSGQLCGVPGCDNVKRYTCARSGVALCSLNCYQRNLSQLSAVTST